VLIAGLPRSGTTWAANALARTEGATLVHEPDNDRIHVAAMAAKARLGRYPVLGPGDDAEPYRRLFEAAFGVGEPGRFDERRRRWAASLVEGVDVTDIDRVMGESPPRRWPWRLAAARYLGRPPEVVSSAGPRIVKSVHGALSLGWVVDVVRPSDTVVLLRHPANVIGSWRDMGWKLDRFWWHRAEVWERFGPPDANPGPGRPETYVDKAAWQFALLANALVSAASSRSLPIVDHEDLLADPAGNLAGLAERLGLRWTAAAQDWVAASDRPGEGYELNRRISDLRGRWQTRLAPDDLAVVADVIERFPLLAQRWPLR
jgi:hypothetical protein